MLPSLAPAPATSWRRVAAGLSAYWRSMPSWTRLSVSVIGPPPAVPPRHGPAVVLRVLEARALVSETLLLWAARRRAAGI